jgi:MscS family membrane protein
MDVFFRLIEDWSAFLAPYPWARALLVVSLFLLLAWLVDRLISGIVRRLVERTETSLDDRLLRLLHRPVFTTVALMGLVMAAREVDLAPEILLRTTALVKTVLIIVWVIFGLGASKMILRAMGSHPERFDFVQHTTEPLLRNAFAVLLFLAGVYGILIAWEINVTGLVASAGILGLALSFAAQDTLANLFAGIAILTDQPYRIGDYIILDSGERGQVTFIGLRSTRLLTRDDVEVSIPNSVMGSAKIVNEAKGVANQYRIQASVGVAYGSDIDRVMEALLTVGRAHPLVLPSPEPRVRFRQFGESSLDFDLLCWIANPADRGLAVHELNCEIYRKLAEEKITIPFPQRDLYIKEMPPSS